MLFVFRTARVPRAHERAVQKNMSEPEARGPEES